MRAKVAAGAAYLMAASQNYFVECVICTGESTRMRSENLRGEGLTSLPVRCAAYTYGVSYREGQPSLRISPAIITVDCSGARLMAVISLTACVPR
jgi:hypothetical protein